MKLSKPISALFTAFVLPLVSLNVAQAQIFVEVPGIPGDVTLSGYEGLIAAESVSTKFLLNTCEEIDIGKLVDMATPKLIEATARGVVFPLISIKFLQHRQDGTLGEYFSLDLQNAVFTETATSGDADSILSETNKVRAESILLQYFTGKGIVQTQVDCTDKKTK